PSASVRDAVLIEDDFPLAAVQHGFPLRSRTIVTKTHRYSRDSDGFEMLCDLVDEPDELVNLAVDHRDPGARIDAVDALVDEMTRADDLTLPVTLQTSR
ncbi:MAG: hypothetical protein ACO31G_09935, partial [Ilumatobacteraceae bacterium]